MAGNTQDIPSSKHLTLSVGKPAKIRGTEIPLQTLKAWTHTTSLSSSPTLIITNIGKVRDSFSLGIPDVKVNHLVTRMPMRTAKKSGRSSSP